MSRRGFGSVRRRQSGKWEARYRDNRGETHYRYFPTRAEADAHLALTNADMLRGDWLDPRMGQMTVAEWADVFMASKRSIRPRTRELYTYLLRSHVLPAFGTWQLTHITAADVEAWMTRLHGNPRLSASTAAKALRLCSQLLALAVKHRRIAHNPCLHVQAPTIPVGEMMFLNPAQLADLASAVGTFHAPWRTMMALAGYGGLRWGECIGLPVRNVDPLRSRVRVDQQLQRDGTLSPPKTSKGQRWVALPRWLSTQLAEAISTRSPANGLPPEHTELVFFTREGTPLLHNSTWLRRVWRPAVAEALPPELHGFRFHDLRHTAVAIALDTSSRTGHPLNPKQLQERMGHSTIRMTLDRYGHLFEGHDDELVAAMSDPFAQSGQRHQIV